MNPVNTDHLEALGSARTTYTYTGADVSLLETFASPFSTEQPAATEGYFSLVTITAPEFTSLCPKTGQPDFATIVITYKPDQLCVESKSLKLYLGSFRNMGEFHEGCVARIARDLIALMRPFSLSVEGQFTPRGGIKFWPRVDYERWSGGVPFIEEINEGG